MKVEVCYDHHEGVLGTKPCIIQWEGPITPKDPKYVLNGDPQEMKS